MHELDDLLSRVEPFQHVLAERLRLHAGDEVPHDLEVDVRLEQCQSDLAHRLVDRLLIETPRPAEIAESRLEPV